MDASDIDLSGQVAFVTGGGGGIGRACALCLADMGADVAIVDVVPDRCAETAEQVVKRGRRALQFPLNVMEVEPLQNAVAETAKQFGRLDILVNNAGVVEFGDPETIVEADYRRILSVSLDGVVFGTKHAIPAMRAGGGGSIVNMASIAAIRGESFFAAYCAAKGAIDAYTRATAVHCLRTGTPVRCNSILPSGIDTPMVQSLPEKLTKLGGEAPPQDSSTAVNRLGTAEDVAHLVLFLASDDSRFINGQSHAIDDGASIVSGPTVPR